MFRAPPGQLEAMRTRISPIHAILEHSHGRTNISPSALSTALRGLVAGNAPAVLGVHGNGFQQQERRASGCG